MSWGEITVDGAVVCAVTVITVENIKPASAIAFGLHTQEAKKNKHFVTAQKSSPFTQRHVAHPGCVHSKKAV